jgi:type IV pilus assembly protein PilF
MTMTSLPARLPWLRVLAALALLGALSALSGCATTDANTAAPGELHTTSDDTPIRQRARTRLTLAASYFQNGQSAVALDETKKALQIDPSFPDAYNLGGLIYMAMGERQLAMTHFQRALSLNANDPDTLHNLGWLQCQEGQYAQAAQSFQRAMAAPLYQNRAKTLMAQGICEARAGDKAKAEQTLLESYKFDPGNPVTGYNLALLLYERGDYAKAQFYIRRINNSELSNASSLWLGIRVEHKLDNRVAMEQLASQLQRRFADSAELKSYEKEAFDE